MTGAVAPFDTTPVHAWVIEAGLAGLDLQSMVVGFCERLGDLRVARMHVSMAALHPQTRASMVTWRRAGAAEVQSFLHVDEERDAWKVSPFRHMIETGTTRLRRRLATGPANLDFPVLQEFREAGYTDWLAGLYAFGWRVQGTLEGELGMILSFASDAADGWSDGDLAAITELAGTFALATKATSSFGRTQDLLATYIGDDAAGRVMHGSVRRGAATHLEAVILLADLRGFTRFADATDAAVVVRRLNDCLDAIGGPVEAAGGQILKFLGDGLLAVFLPSPGADRREQCARALGAARLILDRIAALDSEALGRGETPLPVDIALHEGAVLYGNVGTERRLDFTVIGPAVNEAARLEGLCRTLGVNLAISDSFRRAAGPAGEELAHLGRHALHGLDAPRDVYTATTESRFTPPAVADSGNTSGEGR